MRGAILPIVASLSFVGAFPQAPAGAAQCKAIPGDATWPAAEKWTQMLPAAVARGAQSEPKRPDYRVDAKSVDDVQKAVTMARESNVRLSVITTGHDQMGRNDAPSGILIGMQNLMGIRIESSFTASAQGAAPVNATMPARKYKSRRQASGGAVTFGAGTSTQMLNNELAKSGLYTMGAEHGEVSVAGGWGQCGGHGPMTSTNGLGVDNVLEYQVVTADGKLTIANAASNPDLFWALRGGCGGTFGVVVQATVKTFPSPKFTVTNWWLNSTDDNAIFTAAAELHKQIPALNSKGVQGYYDIYPKSMKGIFHVAGDNTGEAYSKQLWDSVLQKMAGTPGIMKESLSVKYTDFADYKAYFDANWGAMEMAAEGGAMVEEAGHSHGGAAPAATTSAAATAMAGHSHGGAAPAATTSAAATAAAGHSHGGAAPVATTSTAATPMAEAGHSHGGTAPVASPIASTATPAPAASSAATNPFAGLLAGLFGSKSASAPAATSTAAATNPFAGLLGMFGQGKGLAAREIASSSEPSQQNYARGPERWGSVAYIKRHGPESDMDAAKPLGGGLAGGDSRLLTETALNHPNLASALKQIINPGGMIRGGLIAGGPMSKMGQDTSVNPMWRKSYVSLATVAGDNVAALAALDPSMGAYANEGNWNEANWKQVFWGSSYDRLSQIKTQWDPQTVFWVTPGINADQWAGDAQGRLCKASGLTAAISPYPPKGDNQNVATTANHGTDMAPFPVLGSSPAGAAPAAAASSAATAAAGHSHGGAAPVAASSSAAASATAAAGHSHAGAAPVASPVTTTSSAASTSSAAAATAAGHSHGSAAAVALPVAAAPVKACAKRAVKA